MNNTDTIDPNYEEFERDAILRGDIVTIDFSTALALLKGGQCVSRLNWNGPGQWLHLQVPDWDSKMTLPYIYINTVSGDKVPWLASQTDLLSNDWYVVAGIRADDSEA